MSEWWSYRLSDFLLFSARTYYRLFELYNADIWPAGQIAAGLVGLALVFAALRGGVAAARSACALLAGCWLWVAWAFHLQRYAAINWAATGFAAAFALEGMLLLAIGGTSTRLRIGAVRGLRGYAGVALLLFALLVQPWLGMLFGRSWRQAELFALAPDPSALGTLGLLLLLRPVDGTKPVFAWLLWPIPLLWCLVSAATLWTMQAPDALLLPCAALLAVFAARAPSR